ncbi:hypothetical protein [Halomicronema hongdechloris]|nr:hypothetical protein [Halomicronema hongdechloris]
MSYSFDIIGVAPVIEFFQHQQQIEISPRRSRAFLGSYHCTLDGFIEATEMVHRRPNWNWDAVINAIVAFWLEYGDHVHRWKAELEHADSDSVVVARVANVAWLRDEFETLFEN